MPLSFTSFAEALDWRNPASGYWWLALAAVVVITLALWRQQFGAALLMAAALYVSIQHLRYKSLFACIVVVVGSTILTEALDRRRGSTRVAAKRFGVLRLLPVIAAIVLCLLTCVRIVDLASNRSYLRSDSEVLFGPGESWWFPERAAALIQREHFPGNIFQLYNLGGFTAWRLGPTYGDFIDGRNVSHAVWEEQQELLSSALDSPVWEAESDRRSINILFFSLARFYGLGDQNLLSLCQSQQWPPSIWMRCPSCCCAIEARTARDRQIRGQLPNPQLCAASERIARRTIQFLCQCGSNSVALGALQRGAGGPGSRRRNFSRKPEHTLGTCPPVRCTATAWRCGTGI